MVYLPQFANVAWWALVSGGCPVHAPDAGTTMARMLAMVVPTGHPIHGCRHSHTGPSTGPNTVQTRSKGQKQGQNTGQKGQKQGQNTVK